MTPLERAARAVGEAVYGYADPADTPDNWARSLEAVRTVVTAMREPSEVMAAEGGHQGVWGEGYPDERGNARGVWQAMIDAMLEEG